MKLQAFLTLEAVIRGGSFAAAAAEMNLTPSAVSMQMKQLETYLGLPLFDRSGTRVRPRPSAIDVAAAMRQGLARVEELRQRPATTIEGTLHLGVIESLMAPLLPGALSMLRAAHPRLAIKPSRGRSATLIAAVKAGHLDAAVTAVPDKGGGERLQWWPLARRELVLIAPPEAQESSPTALLRHHDWIRYDRQTVTGAMAARHVLSLIPDKRSSLELDSSSAILAMVSQGLGVSVIHLLDGALSQIYPVREVRLGRGAPVLNLAMVTRKSGNERALRVLKSALAAQFA